MAAPAAHTAELTVAASPAVLGTVRAALHSWLTALSWPDGDAEEIVFCVSEAITNVVEHAYTGAASDSARCIHIAGRVEAVNDPLPTSGLRWLCIDIHDTGRWREPNPRRPGLGLHLLRQLLDNMVVITRGTPDYGTTVSLRSRPVTAGPRTSTVLPA